MSCDDAGPASVRRTPADLSPGRDDHSLAVLIGVLDRADQVSPFRRPRPVRTTASRPVARVPALPTRRVPLALAAVVLSMPVTGMSAAIARDAPVPPPVIEAAVIPETPRVQRMRRYSAVRSIRSLLARRLRDARMRRASRESRAGPGVSRKTWQARGPPSAKDILSAM